MSEGLSDWQKKGVPLSIVEEFKQAEDKVAKRQELRERYPKCESLINFLCCCNYSGTPIKAMAHIGASSYMLDFIKEYPPNFKISDKCCDSCKKHPAHLIQKNYDLIITGERKAEGGARTNHIHSCFTEQSNGQFHFRPLFYVSDKDKQWYKEEYGIRYSDAYEVYGLTRTGCCGCSISSKAVEELEKIRPYEPNVVKAAWAIFGKSYEYRQKYNEYKEMRKRQEKGLLTVEEAWGVKEKEDDEE